MPLLCKNISPLPYFICFHIFLNRNDEPTEDANAEETMEISETEVESLETVDLTTTKAETVIKPKLSGPVDSFFLDDNSSEKPPGVNHLMER